MIYDELMLGKVTEQGRRTLTAIVEQLSAAGADSVILGYTKLGLLLKSGDVSVTVFDTAEVRIRAALEFALSYIPPDVVLREPQPVGNA